MRDIHLHELQLQKIKFSCKSNVCFPFFVIVTLSHNETYSVLNLFFTFDLILCVVLCCGAQTFPDSIHITCYILPLQSQSIKVEHFTVDLQILTVVQNNRAGLNKQDNPLLVFILYFIPNPSSSHKHSHTLSFVRLST